MSHPSKGVRWEWDYATGQYVRYSQSKRHWVDKDERKVRAPQTAPSAQGAVAPPQPRDPGVTIAKQPAVTRSAPITTNLANLSLTSSTQRPQAVGAQGSGVTQLPGSSAQQTLPARKVVYSATIADEKTGQKTRWEVGETTPYRDPTNPKTSRSLNVKHIRETENAGERVAKDAGETAAKAADRYKIYSVIEVVLVPPDDAESSNISRITPTGSAGATRVRRFVIMRELSDRNAFEAIPIKTYGGRGVASPGVIKAHHSIIYTGKRIPTLLNGERPTRNNQGVWENGMQPNAIRVRPYDLATALDPQARLDYASIHQFDWGVSNIRLFGIVHEDSQAALSIQYRTVWHTIRDTAQAHAPVLGSSASSTTAGLSRGSLAVASGSVQTRALTAAESGASSMPGSSIRANVGSSRAASTISTAQRPTEEQMARAYAILQRYVTRNSGSCSEQEMWAIVRYLEEHARRDRVEMPAIQPETVSALARNAERRAAWIQNIRARWPRPPAVRVPAQGTVGNNNTSNDNNNEEDELYDVSDDDDNDDSADDDDDRRHLR